MGSLHTVTRRAALKSLVGAAAGPLILTPGRGRAAPSERITMGFIGVGNMGRGNLAAFLGRPEVQVVAICDVKTWEREAQAQVVRNRYGQQTASGDWRGVELYNDYRDLLAREDIDAVMVATPDHWHAQIEIDAVKSGKDVYGEKPLTLTIREGRALVDAVRRYGRVFQTGSQQRSESNFRLACELVRNGRIGRVEQVNVNVGGPSADCYFPTQPVPEGLDWDRWLGPAPFMPYNEIRGSGDYGGGWRQVRDYSGGGMTDWGAHHFDICQWGLGRDGDGPVEVHAPDGKDYQRLTYVYADGVRVQHGGGGNGVLFIGAEGRVEVNRGHLQAWPEAILREPIAPNEIHLYRSEGGHHQDFLNCVRTRRRPICDVAIGHSSVTVCHLGNIAYWTGRSFQWNPRTEELTGDAECARWLDRPRRAPWLLD